MPFDIRIPRRDGSDVPLRKSGRTGPRVAATRGTSPKAAYMLEYMRKWRAKRRQADGAN
jgi:hypothetical protein